MSHTPGPWHLVGSPSLDKGNPWSVYGPDHHLVAFASVGRETAEANARLIAAAPELLECVKYLCDELEAQFDHDVRTSSDRQGRKHTALSVAIGSHCRELEAQRRDIDSLHERLDALERRLETLTDQLLQMRVVCDARDWDAA